MTAALLGAALWLEGATRKKVAISENHVSTATAQQSVCIFSSGVAATATATADSGSGSQRTASSDRS